MWYPKNCICTWLDDNILGFDPLLNHKEALDTLGENECNCAWRRDVNCVKRVDSGKQSEMAPRSFPHGQACHSSNQTSVPHSPPSEPGLALMTWAAGHSENEVPGHPHEGQKKPHSFCLRSYVLAHYSRTPDPPWKKFTLLFWKTGLWGSTEVPDIKRLGSPLKPSGDSSPRHSLTQLHERSRERAAQLSPDTALEEVWSLATDNQTTGFWAPLAILFTLFYWSSNFSQLS